MLLLLLILIYIFFLCFVCSLTVYLKFPLKRRFVYPSTSNCGFYGLFTIIKSATDNTSNETCHN